MAPTFAAKTDANHQEIRDGLRKLGFTCIDTFTLGMGKPDLVVIGMNRATNLTEMSWWEIKGKGGKLTEKERDFFNGVSALGHARSLQIARSLEDILEWYGHHLLFKDNLEDNSE